MDITVQAMPPQRVIWGTGTTPLGDVLLGLTEEGALCRVTYMRNRTVEAVLAQWHWEWVGTTFRRGKVLKGWMTLPLVVVGTELQGVIWAEIMNIRKGKVASYGQIAELVGAPGRARAVGRACRMSCLDYVVPCHRVVAAKGLGGYGVDGTAFKAGLLRAEGVEF